MATDWSNKKGAIRLVEVIDHDRGWKGTWYRKGERVFVRRETRKVYRNAWSAIDTVGGINEADCRVIRGPITWLKCRLKGLQFVFNI